MIIVIQILATAAQTQSGTGWGGFGALIVAGGTFWGGTVLHEQWKARKTDPSPSGQKEVAAGTKPQINGGAETVGTDLEPALAAPTAAPSKKARLESFVAQRTAQGVATMDIVREAEAKFRVSKNTVLRAMKSARESAEAQS